MRAISHLSVVGKSLAVGSFLEGTIRVPPFLAPLTFFSTNLGAGLAAYKMHDELFICLNDLKDF